VAVGFYVVRAALMNMSSPIGDSFLMGIIVPEQRGLASAVNSIIWRLPNSITTVVGGILMGLGLLDLPIFLAVGFYLVSISLFYAVFHNVRPTTRASGVLGPASTPLFVIRGAWTFDWA
jgi:hypothetical protein